MATRVIATKTGLKLVCDVSAVPVPRPRQVFPLPDLHGAGWTFLTLAARRDSNTGALSLVATVDADLPGRRSDAWTLHWSGLGANGTCAVAAGDIRAIAPVQEPAPYQIWLSRQDAAGAVTIYPAATIDASDVWDPSHAYVEGDTCTRNGIHYTCLQACTKKDPTLTIGYWGVIRTSTGGGGAGLGVPAGGTTGQVLRKKSDTDGDTEWADAGSGGGISWNQQSLLARTSAVPVMTSASNSECEITASSAYSGTPAWNAFDAAHDGWVTYGTGLGAPQWVQAHFLAAAKIIKSYAIQPWSNDTWPARWLTAWHLDGSNDGSNWTVLDSRTHLLRGWVPFVLELFEFTNSTPYEYYRLVITGNGGDFYVGLQYLGLYED